MCVLFSPADTSDQVSALPRAVYDEVLVIPQGGSAGGGAGASGQIITSPFGAAVNVNTDAFTTIDSSEGFASAASVGSSSGLVVSSYMIQWRR